MTSRPVRPSPPPGHPQQRTLSPSRHRVSTTRLAFLSNSWLEGDNWGPFQRSLIDLFRPVVDEMLVVRVNSFFHPWTDVALSDLHFRKFLRVIKEFDPTIVFSANRAGLAKPVVDALPRDARIVTLFIDYYDRVPDALKHWTARDFVWGTGTGWLRDNFVRKYGEKLAPDQIEFALWASDTTVFYPRGLERDLGILFVGSPLQQDPFYDLVAYLAKNHARELGIFLETYFAHRERYVHDVTAELERRGFDIKAIQDQPYAAYFPENWIMQTFMSDQISSEVRLKYLSALADLDLHIYGEPERLWIQFMSMVNANLFRRYHFRPVKDPAELPALYNRTRIGLNIQHHHANDVGLSMRVFDVMACGGLLLTHRIANPPLEELGYRENEDFAAFGSIEELREKARFFLENEERRSEIAESGCRKTHEHHSLQKRLAQVFRKAGFPVLADGFAALTREQVASAKTPVTYLSDPDKVELPAEEMEEIVEREKRRRRPKYPKQPFPRSLREVRAAIGRMLPDELVEVDKRLYRNWFLTFVLKRDPVRGRRT